MFWPKKIILFGLVLIVTAIFAGAANAADTVGIVDSQKILFQHPNFDEVTRTILYLSRPLAPNQMELADKREDESMRMLLRKYSDLLLEFIGLDREIAAEKDTEKKNDLAKARQARLDQVENRLMDPIHKECLEAMRAVMVIKKITVVVELDSVYYGGIDITEDVIKQLKSSLRKR